MSFPKTFLWGGSISAAQSEGAWNEGGKAPIQVDYALVSDNHAPRKIVYQNADGSEGRFIQFDQLPKGASYKLLDGASYTNHKGVDFYHRYKEDIALLAEMGCTTFNTTISWARIYPRGVQGGVNREGVAFYRAVFEECRKYHITPIITLSKYDDPVYFEQAFGGWKSRLMIDEFIAFASLCLHEYGDLVKTWITFNEINILLVVRSIPGSHVTRQERFQQLHHQMVASSKVVQLAHVLDPEMKVGCMVAGMCSYPLTPDPADVIANYTNFQNEFCYCADTVMRGAYPSYAKRLWAQENIHLEITPEDTADLKKGAADFLAFSYYMSSVLTTHKGEHDTVGGNLVSGVRNPYLTYSDWGWAMDPTGFKYFLHLLYDRYQKPLFDVENGLGAYDELTEDKKVHDDYRIDYHRRHIKAMKEAVEEGVDLLGYTAWGIIDLVAFSTGEVSKRYGFVYVDVDDNGNGTMERYRKDSFWWYQKAIRSNGEDLD